MPDPDFAEVCTQALIQAKKEANSQGRLLYRSDIVKIIRQLDLKRQGKPEPKSTPAAGAGRTPLPRKRDLHFDALAEAFDKTAFTRSEAALLNKVKCEILEADPTATPEQMKSVAMAVRRKYGGATPKAVTLHWHDFAPRSKPTTTGQRYDVGQEPPNWHEAAKRAYPGTHLQVLNFGWFQLPEDVRRDILKHL